MISGRDAAKLDEALAAALRLDAPAGAITAMPLDVADAAAVERVAAAIEAAHGRIDILVNSAGINFPKRYWGETDAQTFAQVVAVNLNGATYCTLAAARGMRARREGTVINVASFAGWHFEYIDRPGLHLEQGRHDGADALVQHRGVRQRPARHGAVSGRGCDTDPEEGPVQPSEADKARMLQEADLGRTIRFIAEQPAHVCINEMVISPVWNRTYVADAPLVRKKAA